MRFTFSFCHGLLTEYIKKKQHKTPFCVSEIDKNFNIVFMVCKKRSQQGELRLFHPPVYVRLQAGTVSGGAKS